MIFRRAPFSDTKKALTEKSEGIQELGNMANVRFVCRIYKQKETIGNPMSFNRIGKSASSFRFQNFVRVNTRGKLLRQGKGRALQLVLSPDGNLLLCLVCVFVIYFQKENACCRDQIVQLTSIESFPRRRRKVESRRSSRKPRNEQQGWYILNVFCCCCNFRL